MEAAALSSDPVRQRYAVIYSFLNYGYFLASQRPSTLAARLELEESWGGASALISAVDAYDYVVDGPVHRGTASKLDHIRYILL